MKKNLHFDRSSNSINTSGTNPETQRESFNKLPYFVLFHRSYKQLLRFIFTNWYPHDYHLHNSAFSKEVLSSCNGSNLIILNYTVKFRICDVALMGCHKLMHECSSRKFSWSKCLLKVISTEVHVKTFKPLI